MNFPKEYSNILDKYNISKEFNKNKSFLLELDNIPDLIYGIDENKEWFLAVGKKGLYAFCDSKDNNDDFTDYIRYFSEIHTIFRK